ncbi:ABC transporter substrate-binding protein [Bradyrhizobium sp. USDA 4454]
MLRSGFHFVAVTVLCALATISASSQENQVRSDPLDRDRLWVGSGSKGGVRIISTSDTVEVKGLLGEWHRLHPDIRVDYIHQSSLDIYEDVVKCREQGQCADIAWSSAMDLQVKLVNDGYAQPFTPTDSDRIPDWAIWRKQAFGITAEPISLVYNKRLVPPEDVPRTRADLLKLLTAKRNIYQGKVASYDAELSGTGFLFFSNDVQITPNTWSLIRGLGQAGVRLYTFSHTILDRVASGEHLLAYNLIASYALERAKEDPSIGVTLFTDYTALITRIAIITKTAPHPAEAALFMDFLLSRNGQEQLAARSFGTVRTDLPTGLRATVNVDTLRPIRVGPDLLANLDQSKRKAFFREWRRALDGR